MKKQCRGGGGAGQRWKTHTGSVSELEMSGGEPVKVPSPYSLEELFAHHKAYQGCGVWAGHI